MSAKNSKLIEELRQRPYNKQCMDCQEKGTTYAVMNLGIFVCSRCAGLHRELNHKVKGLGMCLFTDDEVAFLTKWGNENARQVWLKKMKKAHEAPPKDNVKLKEHMRAVYEQKRFYGDNEEEEKAKKHKKKSRRAKKEESESEEEQPKEEKKAKEPEKPKEKKHAVTPSEKKPSAPLIDILDFGDSTEPAKEEPLTQVAPSWATFSLPKEPVEEKKPPIVPPVAPVKVPEKPHIPPAMPSPLLAMPAAPEVPPQLQMAIRQYVLAFCQQYGISIHQYAAVVNNLPLTNPAMGMPSYVNPIVQQKPQVPVKEKEKEPDNPFDLL